MPGSESCWRCVHCSVGAAAASGTDCCLTGSHCSPAVGIKHRRSVKHIYSSVLPRYTKHSMRDKTFGSIVVVKALFHDGDHVTFITRFSMDHQSHPLLHTQLYNEEKLYVSKRYINKIKRI